MVEKEQKIPPHREKDGEPGSIEQRHVEIPVDRFDDGRRLDLLLSGRYRVLSRSLWQRRIRCGEVTVDDRPVRPSRLVREHETIRFSYDLKPEPEVDTEIAILYEDDSLLIINKSANLPVHASGSYRKHTLNELLMERYSTDDAPFVCRPVHRLDRETSGIIVYAKSTDTARQLTRSFMSGHVRKEYLVIVFGAFPESMSCSGTIGPDSKSAIRKKQAYVPGPSEHGVSCRTDFWLEKRFRLPDCGTELSLLRARLFTGRMHQIRATLCSLGYPVVGDRLYGPDEEIYLRLIRDEETEADRRRLVLNRSALHCALMAFPHPIDGQEREFSAPLPPDMKLPGN